VSRPAVRRATSAGGVVYRVRGELVEVVLVGRPRHRLWALPKGRPQQGESLEQTALREVSEETGLEVAIAIPHGRIGSISYSYALPGEGVRVQKDVHHYLMQSHGGDVSLHDDEYEQAQWFDIHEAERRLTYGNERSILARAGGLIGGDARSSGRGSS
jgi:8-oxo-dGTP pyrophosphatase MutT (NUDIX family)